MEIYEIYQIVIRIHVHNDEDGIFQEDTYFGLDMKLKIGISSIVIIYELI